jgi:hypothetical protein
MRQYGSLPLAFPTSAMNALDSVVARKDTGNVLRRENAAIVGDGHVVAIPLPPSLQPDETPTRRAAERTIEEM